MMRLFLGLAAGLLCLGANADASTDNSAQIAELKARNVRIESDRHTGAVRLVGAWHEAPLMVPAVNEVSRTDFAADEAVKHFGPLFGLERPEHDMVRLSEKTNRRGGSLHRYRQYYNGLPILAAEMMVNLDEFRRVVSMSGEISRDLDVETRADLSSGQARRLALETVAKWYKVQSRPLQASTAELWIVDPKLLKPGDRAASIAWRIEVTDRQEPHSIRELLFIDANTAGITLHINLIERAKNRRTYTANGSGNLPGTLVCDESDPYCVLGDTEARNAHQFAGDTYDFYFVEHGRDSLDDAGQSLVSTVHYSDFLCPNAFWNGSQMVYCTGLAVDDVVGHELTHGITENTSQLLYYYESGAINESLSDIWGEFIDLGNGAGDDSPSARWLIGEDLTSTVGVIRNMANPPALGDPDKMSSPDYFVGSADNGGVHYNSGIGNKAAYLMTDGDTFNGITVNGLGISKVADIYYEAQTNLLTSGSDYADLHAALNQACQNLIGTGGITSVDCLNVQAAVDAVEMDTDPLGYHPDAPVCIGGDPPDDLFFDDFESGTSQWQLVNVSGSPIAAWVHDFGYASSGEFMLWGRDSFASTDATAEMNVDVTVPMSDNPYLHFRHSFAFEESLDWETFEVAYWDGGFFEYSTDAGATWTDAAALIERGQDYTGTIYNNPANPNASHPAFGGESHGYVSTRADLSSLRGQDVRFRWHTSTDGFATGAFGWVLDDVRIYTCSNEPPPPVYVAFSDATYIVSEASVSATITVNRTGGASRAFTIDYTTADLGATAGADYAATSGTLNFADGENSQTFSVPIFEDGLVEGSEAIVLTLSATADADLGDLTEALLLIADNDSGDVAWIDDSLPVGVRQYGTWNWVSTGPTPYSGGLAHQSTLLAGFHQHYFTHASAPLPVQTGDTLYAYVYLDPANPPREVMLSFLAGGSWEHRAYWGEDLITHVGTNGTNSRRRMGPLPPTGQWVRLEIPASAIGLEGAAISGIAFSLYDGRATWDTTGITSTPLLAKIVFSDAAYSVNEGNGSAVITVSRTGSTVGNATVNYATSDGSALAGSDYVTTSGTLSFAGGEASQTFIVPIIDDAQIEGSEAIVLSLSNVVGAEPGDLTGATLTINDNDSGDFAWMDDALPAGAKPYGPWNWVSTDPTPYSGGLAHKSALAAGFHQHYFTGASPTLQVQAGDTLYAYVYLDPANPPREVMLSWDTNGTWKHNVYWGENLINVGVNGTDSRRYMGPLPPTGQWVRLEVLASADGLEGAAVKGMAFSLFDGRATWDTTGVTSTSSQASVFFSNTTYSVSETDASAVITVNRTGNTAGTASVNYATADGNATAGSDYAAASGTLNFAAGESSRTFSIAIIDDGLIEDSESVVLSLSNAVGADLGTLTQATLSINDNDNGDVAWMDDAPPAGAKLHGPWNWVSTDPAPYSGSLAHQSALAPGFHQHYFTSASPALQVQAGDTLYAYIFLDPANPPREVMLSWDTNGTWKHNVYWGENLINVGVNGTDSRRHMGPLPPTGQWVRLEVPASADGLEGAAVKGMAFSLFDGRATWDTTGVTSTPFLAKLVFSSATYTVNEADESAVITVNRSGIAADTASVNYATADGNALAGADYLASSGTLTFAAGESSQTFSVPVFEDGLIEGSETILLTLSDAVGAELGSVSQATLSIDDNDSNDVAWFDDAPPPGAKLYGPWNWVGMDPAPYSGGLAHKSALAAGFHQHYFTSASPTLQVQAGDSLYAYIYLDPANPPREVMLSWDTNNTWKHNVYWGENLINVGVDGTDSRRYVGPLPPTGEWVRLEIPASLDGLEGAAVRGMAFSLFDGRATWDATGIARP
jgi:Zn-dependent metalloprotease/phosphatidylethanolamine-binding protein (PEBP) family uncharacterized protein